MPDRLNLIEEKVKNDLEIICTGKDFSEQSIVSTSNKINNKTDFMKLKSCTQQRTK